MSYIKRGRFSINDPFICNITCYCNIL